MKSKIVRFEDEEEGHWGGGRGEHTTLDVCSWEGQKSGINKSIPGQGGVDHLGVLV